MAKQRIIAITGASKEGLHKKLSSSSHPVMAYPLRKRQG